MVCLAVCVGQVFMREVARQRLQDLLHQEVLRRIVNLQRRFRAVRERKSFLRMKHATRLIQVLFTSPRFPQPRRHDLDLFYTLLLYKSYSCVCSGIRSIDLSAVRVRVILKNIFGNAALFSFSVAQFLLIRSFKRTCGAALLDGTKINTFGAAM